MAAEKTGRHGRGMEIDPYYVDTIIRRLRDIHGLKATHATTNIEFEALSALRLKRKRET